MIETVAAERIETITNAEQAKRTERLERIARWSAVLPQMQADAAAAMSDGDFERGVNLGKAAKEMKAELDALQAEEAAYIASLAPSSEDAADAEEDNK